MTPEAPASSTTAIATPSWLIAFCATTLRHALRAARPLLDLPAAAAAARSPTRTISPRRRRRWRGDGDVDAVLLDVAFELPAERLAPSAEPDLAAPPPAAGARHPRAAAPPARQHLPVVLMTSQEELASRTRPAPSTATSWSTLAGADAFDARAMGLLIERVLAERRERRRRERLSVGPLDGDGAPAARRAGAGAHLAADPAARRDRQRQERAGRAGDPSGVGAQRTVRRRRSGGAAADAGGGRAVRH